MKFVFFRSRFPADRRGSYDDGGGDTGLRLVEDFLSSLAWGFLAASRAGVRGDVVLQTCYGYRETRRWGHDADDAEAFVAEFEG